MTTAIKYKYPNKYISSGLFNDLYDTLKYIRLIDCADILERLGQSSYEVIDSNGNYVSIDDLLDIFGEKEFADAVGPVWFWAGPEREKETPDITDPRDANQKAFTCISGTVLCWVLDTILYSVSIHGYDVFRELEIPL